MYRLLNYGISDVCDMSAGCEHGVSVSVGSDGAGTSCRSGGYDAACDVQPCGKLSVVVINFFFLFFFP